MNNTIQFFETNHHGGLVFENKNKILKTLDPIKNLRSGVLHKYYRASSQFIIVETVLSGMKHDFLSGIDVFLLSGIYIKSVSHIMNHHYDKDSSKEFVERILKEALYAEVNIEKYLKTELDNLYGTRPEIVSSNELARVINFINEFQR